MFASLHAGSDLCLRLFKLTPTVPRPLTSNPTNMCTTATASRSRTPPPILPHHHPQPHLYHSQPHIYTPNPISTTLNPTLYHHHYREQVQNLSGGELQRVAMALALGKPSDVYLIDEPSAYLDSEQRITCAKARALKCGGGLHPNPVAVLSEKRPPAHAQLRRSKSAPLWLLDFFSSFAM